jgi:DNA-binding transcriptional ArsR family regulator
MPPTASGWSTPLRVEVGSTLAGARSPVRAREVAAAIGKDASNVRNLLARLADEGLVDLTEGDAQSEGRGRPTKALYRLSEAGRVALEGVAEPVVGRLGAGDHLVLADADDRTLPELLEVLATAESAARSAWSFLGTGRGDRYVIAFQGADAPRRASDLLGILASAKIPSERLIVSEFMSAADRAGDARRRVAEGRRTRMARDTRAA